MIEINLLPGAKKKAARGGGGGGPKLDLAATLAGVSEKVKDKWLVGAVASVLVAALVIGGLWYTQGRQETELQEAETRGLADSTRYAAVVRDRTKAEAKRDTLLRQLNIIKSIDDDRFIWAHILDEVSKALPAYTWLASVTYTGTPQGGANLAGDAAKPAAPAAPPPAGGPADSAKKPAKKPPKKMETEVPQEEVRLRILGQTVDIQALTRFMKQLEASPFLGNVQLAKSELALVEGGKEVTQFTLEMTYTRPDSASVRRVPLAATLR